MDDILKLPGTIPCACTYFHCHDAPLPSYISLSLELRSVPVYPSFPLNVTPVSCILCYRVIMWQQERSIQDVLMPPSTPITFFGFSHPFSFVTVLLLSSVSAFHSLSLSLSLFCLCLSLSVSCLICPSFTLENITKITSNIADQHYMPRYRRLLASHGGIEFCLDQSPSSPIIAETDIL